MIFGTGIDIIEINRIQLAVQRQPRFLTKNFTIKELDYFNSKKNTYESIAGYFAAKEAVSKALGTGFRNFKLIDVEVLKDDLNRPYVTLHNNCKEFIEENGIKKIHLSISHSKDYAVANAIATL